MIQLPLNHFLHLQRLADLRRCTPAEAIDFLFTSVEPHSENWIDQHWGYKEETRNIDVVSSHSVEKIIDRIQGLPRNIRPVTDGFYFTDFEFFTDEPGLLGIRANNVNVLDFEMATLRDKGVFALVKDQFPAMTVEQYRVYNTFASQYLHLVRKPEIFTMPSKKAPAIDAGCYVGYKALALAHFVGDNDVLAFEVASDNFHVLKRNAALNPQYRIRPFETALSDIRTEMLINTRNERTMAHSLTSFDRLKENKTSLLAGHAPSNTGSKKVETLLLDDFTKSYDELSAVHISVNGHEPEVTAGAIETLRKTDIIRISCPYKRDEKLVFDIVSETLEKNNISVFGKSGAAVIAGKSPGTYHVEKPPAYEHSKKPANLGDRSRTFMKALLRGAIN